MGLPGVWVNCCFSLSKKYPTWQTADGCVSTGGAICVDLADPNLDHDGSGDLSKMELVDVCNRKCPSKFPFYGPGFHAFGNPNQAFSLTPPYDGCRAIGGYMEQSAEACDPTSPGHLEPYHADTAPSHEGTLTSEGSGSHTSVTLNDSEIAIGYDGRFYFSLGDCEAVGEGEQRCALSLRALALELAGTPTFGDYRADSAALTLASPETTPVLLSCGPTSCTGTFVFSDATGTALDLNLNWEQTRLSTGSAGGGSLLLSNGPLGLGGLKTLRGTLELARDFSTGTIRLQGSGADALGGAFASASFDLRGSVERIVR